MVTIRSIIFPNCCLMGKVDFVFLVDMLRTSLILLHLVNSYSVRLFFSLSICSVRLLACFGIRGLLLILLIYQPVDCFAIPSCRGTSIPFCNNVVSK